MFYTFLDASQAIDKTDYCKLLSLLLKKNINPLQIMRALIIERVYWTSLVLWNGVYSGNLLISPSGTALNRAVLLAQF